MSAPMAAPRLLVISLGNQAPYYDCLHSTGHFALAAAQEVLAPSQPPFHRERYGGYTSDVSPGSPYIFVQSPTMMNRSGIFVLAAWRDALARHQVHGTQMGLVIVHDELESDFGHVRLRDFWASPQGHNGLKSIRKILDPHKLFRDKLYRISIGIDRPIDRSRGTVSAHVLSRLSQQQRETIKEEVGSKIVNCLREVDGGLDFK
ncbi:peptidyl-tRNA hydrolase [Xylaria nigripes]|nr:peptidyl-tRNA hydrolase [Xylaria nigripes]